jgi:hypothetical protein
MDRNKVPPDPRHLGVPSGVPKMVYMPVVHSAQTMDLSCAQINSITKPTENKLPLDPCHLDVPSVVLKAISEPMEHSAQTVHLSCVKINTISKQTKMSFHSTNVT